MPTPGRRVVAPAQRAPTRCAACRRAAGTARAPASASPCGRDRGRSARRRPPTGGGRGYHPSASPLTSGTSAASRLERRRRRVGAGPTVARSGDPRHVARRLPSRAWRGRAAVAARPSASPATTSSQRNCGAEPSGADRARRTSDGQPASSPSSVFGRHRGRAAPARASTSSRGEGQLVDADLDDRAGGTAQRERDRRAGAPGEDEVGVRREPGHELTEQRRPPSTAAAARGRRRSRCTRRSGARSATASSTCSIGSPRSPACPRAATMAAARWPASQSAGSHDSQASIPRGSAWLARIAWASSVDLPNPAPATITVSGHLEAPTRGGRAGATRTTSPCSAGGGVGARRPQRCSADASTVRPPIRSARSGPRPGGTASASRAPARRRARRASPGPPPRRHGRRRRSRRWSWAAMASRCARSSYGEACSTRSAHAAASSKRPATRSSSPRRSAVSVRRRRTSTTALAMSPLAVDVGERVAAPSADGSFEGGDDARRVVVARRRVGCFHIAAELPQVDVDTWWRRQGHGLAVDAQRRAAGAGHPPRLEHGTQPGQRDAEVAPGGGGVEVGPHQVGEAIATQRPGEHEQLEQCAHPAPTQVGRLHGGRRRR